VRGVPALLPVLACLLLAACGDEDEPKHGLTRETLESHPTGAAVEVAYGVRDGDAYRARIEVAQQFSQSRSGNSRPKGKSASCVIELLQTFTRANPERAPRSAIVFSYVEAVGAGAEAYLAREPVHGTLEHDADGRSQPRTLTLSTGTKPEQGEVLDMVGALLLAGYGGSPPWIPPRPIRVGEAWQLESFVRPRSVDRIILAVKRQGLEAPDPTFSGTARLEAVRQGPDGPELEVVLDALLELSGKIRQDGKSATMSIGDRVRGRAVISAKTGLPLSFQTTHSRRVRVRSAGENAEQEFTSEVEGRVERLEGR